MLSRVGACSRRERGRGLPGLSLCLVLGCDPSRSEPAGSSGPVAAVSTSAGAAAPHASRLDAGIERPGVAAASGSEPPARAANAACPGGMLAIAGGEFWMGSGARQGTSEDRPRFRTRVAPFCLDRHEVTAADYSACVGAAHCSLPHGTQSTCNYGRAGREKHPINCVDWNQAQAFCEARGARLPSELEWEFAGRGGMQSNLFSWGNEPPEGRTCWNRNQSCPVESYAAGAFGLFDMTGNVWEWTLDWFASYPWPPRAASARVYRGGSWSRRFDKWMHTTLRNRSSPESWGSHLGFRCAALNGECPFAAGDRPGTCQAGVLDVECAAGHAFNGMRCAAPGEAPCAPGFTPLAGHGCVSEPGRTPRAASRAAEAEPAELPTRQRSPEFDADCRAHQKPRLDAYRLQGGTHAARNKLGQSLGCKNRDVGVGWNSVCCP